MGGLEVRSVLPLGRWSRYRICQAPAMERRGPAPAAAVIKRARGICRTTTLTPSATCGSGAFPCATAVEAEVCGS
jgi:hypothetical protein